MQRYRRILPAIIFSSLLTILFACGGETEPAETNTDEETTTPADTTVNASGDFQVSSSAFGEGETLPADYACSRDGGGDLSPPLSWSGAPEGVSEYALVMYHYPQGQTDNPSHYWVVWNIPASVTALEAGNADGVGNEGSNKDGVEIGYTPPCSPGDAVHEYTIRVYALSAAPEDLGPDDNLSVGWTEFVDAVEPLSLGMAEISFIK